MTIDDDTTTTSSLQQILMLQQALAQVNQTTESDTESSEFANILSSISSSEETETEESSSLTSLYTDASTYSEISSTAWATISSMIATQAEGTAPPPPPPPANSSSDYSEETEAIDSLLTSLDNYSTLLTQEDSDKAAWEELQNISAQIEEMEDMDLPEELSSLVSEISLLTKNEQFKMNSGSYTI